MKLEAVLTVVVKRAEKRNSLNVVPMEMRNENVGRNGTPVELVAQGLSQHAEARATIENIEFIPDADLHAGGVASIAHIFELRSRCRSTNSPEPNTHRPPCWLNSHLLPRRRIRQFIRWLPGYYCSCPYNGRRDSS